MFKVMRWPFIVFPMLGVLMRPKYWAVRILPAIVMAAVTFEASQGHGWVIPAMATLALAWELALLALGVAMLAALSQSGVGVVIELIGGFGLVYWLHGKGRC